ncbi:hypothetical protein VNO80_05625 [Phaseolus coccineus]|uniref:Transmembrane protein n=1 Tax=Phaseolus coccineus TaxID=3886 RepID=A0AAN9NGB8_PHACN
MADYFEEFSPVGFYVCVVRVSFSFQGGKERGCVYKKRMRLMTLLSQRKKKQERKTLYFCFSISILLCLQKSPAKEFPCWEKIKMIFAYLCFLFFWKQCFARFVCVVMRSSIAFLSLTIMKTVTLPILFSLLLLLLSHTFTSLLFTDFCF